MTQNELMAKMQDAVKDEAFLESIGTKDFETVKKALAEKGIEMTDDEVKCFISGFAGEAEELDEASLENVAGGDIILGVSLILGAGAFAYGVYRSWRCK